MAISLAEQLMGFTAQGAQATAARRVAFLEHDADRIRRDRARGQRPRRKRRRGKAHAKRRQAERQSPRQRAATDRHDAYERYLRSDAWREKRREMLRRTNHRCQLCNTRRQLHVHHMTYERLGDESYEDLRVLCQACHEALHQAPRARWPNIPPDPVTAAERAARIARHEALPRPVKAP